MRKVLEPRFPQRIVCGLALLIAATSWTVTGCREAEQAALPPTATEPESLAPLRVLVIDDPELATVIPRQWQARAERGVAIEQTTTQEFLAAKRKRLGVDAVIYPSGLLGELAQRDLLEPFAEDSLNSSQFARREIFELSRLREVEWGGKVLAVTFGSPQWNLLYRRDIFARLQLTPPKTWSEYGSLVERLTDRAALGDLAPPAGEPWAAVIEPLGPGWAGPLLLARSAAYARHRSQYSTLFDYRTMQPLIGGPPFVRALQELVAVSKHLPPEAGQMGPTEARREFLRGHCAMAITWPSRADDQSAGENGTPAGFAELPGSEQAYNFRSQNWEPRGDELQQRVTLLGVSGRLGSVARESRQRTAATNLLIWLTGELSGEVCPESKHVTLFRTSHQNIASRWTDRQFDETAVTSYAEAVQQAQSRSSWLFAVRISGRDEYLSALDQAVHDAITGTSSAEDALAKVVRRWEQVTDERGRDSQREAYMKSIGLEP